jgi:hypothetical protein
LKCIGAGCGPKYRQIIYFNNLPTQQTGTFEIKIVSSGMPVTIDGFYATP